MALQSDGFVDIDFPTLTSVLSRETLNCREIILFEAALSWAEAECTRQEIDPSPDNKRKVGGLWHCFPPWAIVSRVRGVICLICAFKCSVK